jgi:hypothetical protein
MIINLKFNLQRGGSTYDKPIIKNIDGELNPLCLIDTGANTPVWCRGEADLKEYYPDCVKENSVFIISGFGTGIEIADVYKIPDFVLSDGKNKIYYKDLLIAVINRDFSFHMIISYTMLNKMNISIETFENKDNTHTIAPILNLNSLSEFYTIRPKYINLEKYENRNALIDYYHTDKIMDSIFIFNQI